MNSRTTFSHLTNNFQSENETTLADHQVQISFDSSSVTLYDMVEQFETFLKAVGYPFNGKRLLVVEEDQYYGYQEETEIPSLHGAVFQQHSVQTKNRI